MSSIWILSANSTRATIFTAPSVAAPIVELESFDNPQARVKSIELASDRAGRSFDSHGEGRHAMELPTDARTQVQARFARRLADRLEQGRIAHAFDRLVLVAAPAFLGLLRPHFGASLQAMVSMEVDKDYTALRPRELRERLPERL